MMYLTAFNALIALVVAFYAGCISWKLAPLKNPQAQDVRWLCCALVWVLVLWPLRFFGKVYGFNWMEWMAILMVPAILGVLVSIVKLYRHLTDA